ncbi:hypothetical protein RO3G_12539 [Rhizopus delemar RA 99-880]|uniref:Uncharacterized protein n=1 Tax=Rhizopus delemar (strain RA 99-880 / ATCC MYA-4621 / FGSC 9543 / NRRL 43880) TaxID=246409 RepID=I1CH98_RHIO9|nr:hypothetical protein RO3G_09494 [Rhizopus delemar RA 99-880]EIE87828.1 hypothetical protein RO3G_12539 [Rhizopus delemar RA 99-880]|eukprot:EIE84784.1 hypothetical protein RO3G_09494 [Rhizopus delemar RA 99-880]
MPKKLPSDIQNSIKTLLENSVDPAVIGKRVEVHRNTINSSKVELLLLKKDSKAIYISLSKT